MYSNLNKYSNQDSERYFYQSKKKMLMVAMLD